MSNKVKLAGALANKPGQQINLDRFYEQLEHNPEHLEVEDLGNEYVSRGAYKLKAAAEAFNLDFCNKTVLDIGASTGGFSDYALKHGASAVIALDVGKAQIDSSLLKNPRLLNIESENFRYTEPANIASLFAAKFGREMKIDYMLADLSFISIVKILGKVKEFATAYGAEDLSMVFLIKPQFEAGKSEMDKCAGVIRDEALRARVLESTRQAISLEGFEELGLIESPIRGAKGNVEYLIYLAIAQ